MPRCSVFGCQQREGPPFHFPTYRRNWDRFRRWVDAINNPAYKSLSHEQILKRGFVCRRHFTPDDFLPHNRKLHPDAVPTQNLPPRPPEREHLIHFVPVASGSIGGQTPTQSTEPSVAEFAQLEGLPNYLLCIPAELEAEAMASIDLPPSDPSTVTIENDFESLDSNYPPFTFPIPFISRDRGVQHEEPMTHNVENTEEYNELCSSCRICLKINENMVLLDSPLCEEKDDEKSTEITILQALEKLMSQKLFMHEKWPSTVCNTCRQLLKQAYDFNILFHQSQESLREIFKDHLPKVQHTSDSTCMSENIESVCKSDDKDQGIGEEQHVHCEAEEKENYFETEIDEIDKVFAKEMSSGINCEGKLFSTIVIKKKKSKKIFRCNLCNLICPKRSRLINHLRRCTRPKLLTCRSCGANVSLVGKINDVLCDGCGSVGTLQAASKLQKPQDFLCYICGRILDGNQRAVHMLTHREARFECEICNRKFKDKMRLKVHLDLHKNIRNYLCNICGQTLADSGGLSCHMKRKHSKERNFACEICKKRFYIRADLTQHLKIHNSIKPSYSCGFCGRVCLTSGGARLHKVIHTGERPFKCRYCGKTFVFKPHLKAHEMTHSGPYECNYCDKTFIAEDLFNLHVKQKHKNVDVVS